VNLKQLESFLWVADLQSFTKAARYLYMSQPAVSFQIKSLEEYLQVTLFQRGDKKVILTEAGRILYPEAKQMLIHFQNIKYSIDELRGLKTGHLSLSASTIPGEYIIPLFIGDFNRCNPGIHISLKVSGSGDVTRWVLDRETDLGFTGVNTEGHDIECTPWLMDRLVMIVPPGHELTGKKELHFSETLHEKFILREEGSGTRQVFEKRLLEAGTDPGILNVAMELGSTRAVITAVQAGLGVGVVSGWAAGEPLQTGRVEKVNLTGVDLNRHLYVIKLKNGTGNYAADSFIDFIKDPLNIKSLIAPFHNEQP
jgi:DNA-binding transcriptional LysR family regulator